MLKKVLASHLASFQRLIAMQRDLRSRVNVVSVSKRLGERGEIVMRSDQWRIRRILKDRLVPQMKHSYVDGLAYSDT